MKINLPNKWIKNLEILDFAFQPIINMTTGKIYAVEALLRHSEKLGFKTIFALFDEAYNENVLYAFDLFLREKAIKKFAMIKNHEHIKLFFNLDNRLLSMPDFSDGNTKKILSKYNIDKENICFEISERHEIHIDDLKKTMRHYRDENYCVAIDDFGVGYAGYKLIYDSTPNVIKIDRFFIENIQSDSKKKAMVKSIFDLAELLGIKVIAEGVETIDEFLVCKDIGCHFMQGYLAQRPMLDTKDIHHVYESMKDIISKDKRGKSKNITLTNYIKKLSAISSDTKMDDVIEYFKESKVDFIPILNKSNEPIGILKEKQINEYIYSPFGRSILLKSKNNKTKLKHLTQTCPIADIKSNIANIIALYSSNPNSFGVIITKNFEYYGFLSSISIIQIMNEKNLAFARDQNPLTKLPGNSVIEEYTNDAIIQNENYIFTYFDLDNFKAFNDIYGFRNGDRVIQLFANIMKKDLSADFFKGHIGGDDFFCGVKYQSEENLNKKLEDISFVVDKFVNDVKDFYSQEDKKNGFIASKDRDGNPKNFPLLSVSASVIIIDKDSEFKNINTILSILSKQKKVAKMEYKHISISSLI